MDLDQQKLWHTAFVDAKKRKNNISRIFIPDKFKIELFEPLNKRTKSVLKASGNHHWGFCVKDRTKFCSSLKKKRVPLIELDRGGFISYFIKDPDGNMIEIRD